MVIALHYRQQQAWRIGAGMIFDWLVLIFAFVATALRFVVGTDLDAVRADEEKELLSGSCSGKSAGSMTVTALVNWPSNFQVGRAKDTHV
jgi:hypothetical protein